MKQKEREKLSSMKSKCLSATSTVSQQPVTEYESNDVIGNSPSDNPAVQPSASDVVPDSTTTTMKSESKQQVNYYYGSTRTRKKL